MGDEIEGGWAQEDAEDILQQEAKDRSDRIQRLADELRATEMADSVVILTTYNRDGYTQWASGVSGNSFACAASAEKYMLDKKAEWRG